MTITDVIITQFVNNPGKEFHVTDLMVNTGYERRVIANGLQRMRENGMLADFVQTGRGAYTFKPKEDVEDYKSATEKLVQLLKTKRSVTKEEIAKELDIHPNYVHDLVCRVKRNRGVNVKREVRYVI